MVLKRNSFLKAIVVIVLLGNSVDVDNASLGYE